MAPNEEIHSAMLMVKSFWGTLINLSQIKLNYGIVFFVNNF